MTGTLPRRRLGFAMRQREQREQRPLDRRLPGRRRDFGAEQVGDVEHVDHALAEGRDMGRGDVQIELGQRGRQLVEQARAGRGR